MSMPFTGRETKFHSTNGGVQRLPGLTMDEVTLRPRELNRFRSRREVDLQPRAITRKGAPKRRLGTSNGIWIANMNKVAGERSCAVAALFGGLGVLPQDLTPEQIEAEVKFVKAQDPTCEPAVIIRPDDHVGDVLHRITEMGHGIMVVQGENGAPIGVVSKSDYIDPDKVASRARDGLESNESKCLKFGIEPSTPVSEVMRKDVKILQRPNVHPNYHGRAYTLVYDQLVDWNVDAAPVVSPDGKLLGVMTRYFAAMHARSKAKDNLPPIIRHPSLDENGRLMVAVAVGVNQANPGAYAQWLLSLGVDVIVLDTAHGHSVQMIECIKEVRRVVGQEPILAAGNVGTPEGAEALIQAGADIIKIGIGPGGVCITRVIAGVGCPQLDTVYECAIVASKHGALVIADGGIKEPGHIAKLEAVGGAFFMIGSMAAGVYEAPGKVEVDARGREFKSNTGMASRASVDNRNKDHFDPLEALLRQQYVEGASGRTYINPERRTLGMLFVWLVTGLQSGRSYSNALTQEQMFNEAVLQVQTTAGRHEGTPNARNLGG